MTKRKRQKNRQHNDQKKKTEEQTTQWPKEKDRRICPFVLFLFAIVLSVLNL
jgi:hypothetical protein